MGSERASERAIQEESEIERWRETYIYGKREMNGES